MNQTLSQEFLRCRDLIYLNSISIFQNGILLNFAVYLIIILYLLTIILIQSDSVRTTRNQYLTKVFILFQIVITN